MTMSIPATADMNLMQQHLLQPTNQLASRKAVSNVAGKPPEDLVEAARELESVFLNMMLKAMRKTVEENETFHGGQGETMFSSMLDEHYTQTSTQANGMGIGDMIVKQLWSGNRRLSPAEAPAYFQGQNSPATPQIEVEG